MKTAVIIGATGGIGKELADRLATDGYTIISVSRSGDVSCDLTSYQSIHEAVAQITQRTKKVDLLVHSAGIAMYKNFTEVTDQEMQAAFMINAIAPAVLTRELLPYMHHEGALVLTVGSKSGAMPIAGRTMYCATKYALRGLSLTLSEEYKGATPAFCLITLGSTMTNFGPLSLEDREKNALEGKGYFPVAWVADKLIEVINDSRRENEIVLLPAEHGFGEW